MRTSSLLVALLLALSGAGAGARAADALDVDVSVNRLAVPPASGSLLGAAALEIVGGQGIGGLSSVLTLGDDRLLFASDRGRLFQAILVRGEGRGITGVAGWREIDLPLPSGWSQDFEGLAVSEGNLLVSVEEPPYVIRFEGSTLEPERVASYMTWDDLGFSGNRGFEAITDLPDGAWLAIAESLGELGYAAYTREGRRLTYIAAEGYAPTGADRYGDRLFIVERRLSLLGGWQARVACLDLAALEQDVLQPVEIARFDVSHGIDNLEGLAVQVRDDDLEFLLISDDNQSPLQRTVLLHYRLPGGASGGCDALRHEPAEGQEEGNGHGELGG